MNQKARQRATSSVEKDFYKLLNNSNFGIDCRNNIGNCFLEPLHGDFSEISYIKRFTRILNDDAFRNFFPISFEGRNNSIELKTYQSKIFSLNKEEPTHEARKKYDKQIEEALDAVDS